MISKGCEVNCCFKNGFILGEEHLQTLSSIIKERYPEETLTYRITKSDSYVFQTSEIDEIFNEENSNANYINKLDIMLDNGDVIKYDLCFEKGEDTSLKITGEDKDKIYLLYNEIKTYVEMEITTVKIFLKYDVIKGVCYMIGTLSLMLCLLFMLPSLINNNLEKIDEVLSSSDLSVKLNYIIEHQMGNSREAEKYLHIFIPIAVLSMFLTILPILLKHLFGKSGVLRITDYFLFGKQKIIYDKKVKVKSNIIWTVGIGLAVSIIGGFLVYLLTK